MNDQIVLALSAGLLAALSFYAGCRFGIYLLVGRSRKALAATFPKEEDWAALKAHHAENVKAIEKARVWLEPHK